MITKERGFSDQFTIQDAVKLINTLVLGRKLLESTREEAKLGVIVGVLTLNHEVEVVVKFEDQVRQFTKREFETEITACSISILEKDIDTQAH